MSFASRSFYNYLIVINIIHLLAVVIIFATQIIVNYVSGGMFGKGGGGEIVTLLRYDRRLSAKLVSIFADRGCHVVSATDPRGR
jgi:hypothetical protein